MLMSICLTGYCSLLLLVLLVLLMPLSLSLLFLIGGAGSVPNLLQEVTVALRIGRECVSQLSIPFGLVVGRAAKHLMLDYFIYTIAVFTAG